MVYKQMKIFFLFIEFANSTKIEKEIILWQITIIQDIHMPRYLQAPAIT